MANNNITFDSFKQFLESYFGCKISGVKKCDVDPRYFAPELLRYVTIDSDSKVVSKAFTIKLPDSLKDSKSVSKLEDFIIAEFSRKSESIFGIKSKLVKMNGNWLKKKDSELFKDLLGRMPEPEAVKYVSEMECDLKLEKLLDMSLEEIKLRIGLLGI